MGLLVSLPQKGGDERTLQLNFGIETIAAFLPAEWHQQGIIQINWPHKNTDWAPILDEVDQCYIDIASAIAAEQNLLIITPEPERIEKLLSGKANTTKIHFFKCQTNDTWARDNGFITMLTEQGPMLIDFCFNGWGMKFAANYDNQINKKIFNAEILKGAYRNCLDFVLEGGSIESDGCGTLLTTTSCLLAPNRNDKMNKKDIEEYLKSIFHLKQILWLDHGYLAGDDTDGHIDTLARLCPHNTIAYVQCTDTNDEHYKALHEMELQLREFRTSSGEPYRLLPLPMPDKIIENGERLPATYANFLIMNKTILYPTYNQVDNDKKAEEILAKAFPNYNIKGINCLALIKQHGSLHCATMQYPIECFTNK